MKKETHDPSFATFSERRERYPDAWYRSNRWGTFTVPVTLAGFLLLLAPFAFAAVLILILYAFELLPDHPLLFLIPMIVFGVFIHVVMERHTEYR
jgi:hypothetical protein